ncbi:hypothetical protein II906_03420, partial [bacterium]|nr:hypothetical protein [bacterium]
KESRNFLNFNNIALYGDCLLGFSKSEIWGNIDCFRDNLYYGGPDPNSENGIQTWRLRALNYDLIGECSQEGDCSKLKSAGKLLLQKFKIFFERYDGIRLDAAWQFITPFLYEYKNSIPSQVKTPEMDMTIFNIMKTAKLQAENQNPDSSIMLELVGLSSQRSKEKTLNKYPHLYTTAYSEYGENPKQLEERGYKKSGYYIGVSNHDNDSLNNLSRNHQKRELHTKGFKDNYDFDIEKINFAVNNYTAQSQEYKNAENFRTAKFGEIFTSPNQFFTLPDMFGMSERINTSGQVNDKNWTVRIPTDYENFYFSQLQKGYGLNLPKALAVAMEMNKIQNPELIKKCNEAAEILREEGPSTQAEADKALKDGKLRKVFKYEFIL